MKTAFVRFYLSSFSRFTSSSLNTPSLQLSKSASIAAICLFKVTHGSLVLLLTFTFMLLQLRFDLLQDLI